MAKNARQIESDTSGITRAQVAKRLGRHISWVRRREGKELHPALVDGVHRFDLGEVESLAVGLESERQALEASQAVTDRIHRMFDLHLRAPDRFSVEGIAERVDVDARVVRALHAKWSDEFLHEVPRLLSRKELQVITDREEREAEREHAERMAQWAREDEERLRSHEARVRRLRAEQDAGDAAREQERMRRRAREEQERAATIARAGSPDPDLHAQVRKIAEAKTLQELLRLARELWER
jgi:hypothetical protein